MGDREASTVRAGWPTRLVHLFVVAMLVFSMVACGGDDEPSGSTGDNGAAAEQEEEADAGTVTIGDQEANDHGSEDVSGKTEVELEADDFYFEPTVLTGEAGQEVTLTVANEGDSPHNFSITDQDIDENLDPGDEVEVSVTFPDSGTLVFFCAFHQNNGMLGGLEVGS
jgi:plastocyanin